MITFGFGAIRQEIPSLSLILPIVCVTSGVLLLIGLFTPVTGAVAAVMKTGLAISRFFSRTGDPWIVLALAILATALAMIGPGAWSIDAWLFGRKHIDLSDR
jgi:putative oxidoreductase